MTTKQLQQSVREKPAKSLVEKEQEKNGRSSYVTAFSSVLLSPWPVILALIFGGCCSNVFTLEAIVSEQPDSGHLLTAVQFLFVTIEGYIHFFNFSNGPQKFYLADRKIPLYRWLGPVLLFFSVSMLNNYVWIYRISVPVHIIFRSGGTVTTMIAGLFVGKKYSLQQILSVVVLTTGVIIATLASSPGSNSNKDNNNNKSNSSSLEQEIEKEYQQSPLEFALGVGMLAVAAILSSIQGLVSEKIYADYGKYWKESLFYTHALSLPFFCFFYKDIARQFTQVIRSEPIQLSKHILSPGSVMGQSIGSFLEHVSIPRRLVLLLANAATQYFCVRGVNNLAGNFTALTVSIVLNMRKFVSLLLSIYLFGNSLSLGTIIGSILVFSGAGMYSYSTTSQPKPKTE